MMKVPLLRFMTTLVFLGRVANADDRFVSAGFIQRVVESGPVAELPPHIKGYEKGGLSLIPGLKNTELRGIPLYLVNAGEKDVNVMAQDASLLFKLEFVNEHGEWQRAQAHAMAHCADSYHFGILEAGHFFKVYGYQPKEGRKTKVRFHSKSDGIASQAFEGIVSETDIEGAAFDKMDYASGPSAIVRPFQGTGRWKPESALTTCANTQYLQRVEESLLMWKEYGPIPILKYGGRNFVESLEAAAQSEPKILPFAKQFRALYEKPFHPEASPAQLARYCLSQLDHPQSWRYWKTLSEVYRKKLPPSVRESIVTEVIRREYSGGSFFYDPPLKDLQSNEQLWSILDAAESLKFRSEIWGLLIRRGLKNEVLRKVAEMSEDEVVSVLGQCFVPHSQTGYTPEPEVEVGLWQKGFAHNPLAVSRVIAHALKKPEHARRFDFLWPQVDEFWKNQRERMGSAEGDFRLDGDQADWTSSLALLKNLEPEFDLELWGELAKFPGYTVFEGNQSIGGEITSVVTHEYPVCNKAVEYLSSEGHKVERIRKRQILISKEPWVKGGE